jgi:hypothetical protein
MYGTYNDLLNHYPISESVDDLRTRAYLEKAGFVNLGELPSSEEGLLEIPGIGVKQISNILCAYDFVLSEYEQMQ